MRGFIVTTIIFIAVITTVVINSAFLHRVTDEMLILILELPEEPGGIEGIETFEKLNELWLKNRTLISVSVRFEHVSAINDALDNARRFYQAQMKANYLASRDKLYHEVVYLSELEKATFKNII